MELSVTPHPLLRVHAFTTTFPAALSTLPGGTLHARWLVPGASAHLSSTDEVRGAVRDLLRHGGYKPTGRGKPASEYLLRAVSEGALPAINPAVDACNAVSFHSGLPISVVDLDRAKVPLRVALAPASSSYVFNASGQEMDLSGLICLVDTEGPCANAVKDAQRTKTNGETRRTLSVIWAPASLGDLGARAEQWYRALLSECGATTADVALT
jgi:DNA/RNA-binding domain of Phe-tRNA-synthetase-like protein